MLLVFVAGCASQGSSGLSKTLTIERFEPDIKGVQINPGEEVRFFFDIRNTGTEKAKNIEAKFVGLDGWLQRSGTCNDGQLIAFDLSPPAAEFNTPGEAKNCVFVFLAPEKLSLDQAFQPKIAVKYQYDSITTAAIKIPSRDQFLRKLDSGQGLESETVSKSKSPVDISLATKGAAGELRVEQGKDARFPLFITATNSDGGALCKDGGSIDSCQQSLKKIRLQIETGSANLRLSNCDSEKEIDLFKGKAGELKCDLVASGAADLSSEQSVSVTVKAKEYGYIIEQAANQITVKRSERV